MANWCYGSVEVKGKPKDIEQFCRMFVFEDKEGKTFAIEKKYFARSFTQCSWADFKKDNLGSDCADFNIQFAWSVTTCLIDGYPNGKDYVTLSYACKKHNVSVDIESEEEGMGFEEHITCDNKGNVVEECKEMPVYKCLKCGAEQSMPSNYSIDEIECYDCECYGEFEKVVEKDE